MATKATTIPTEIAELFESDALVGPARPLPHCQLLNDRSNWGLFVKEATLSRIGWLGDIDSHPNRIEHIFSSGDSEIGLLFKKVNLRVLAASDRFVEDRQSKAVIANFETEQGRLAYDGNKNLQLRRLYLLYICDEQGNRLHSTPVTLSVMGVASARFGAAYDQFCSEVDRAYAQLSGKELIPARAKKVYGLCQFTVQFGMEMLGPDKGQKSPITIVEDFGHPDPTNLIQMIATGEEKNFLWQAYDAFSSTFAEKFLRSVEASLGFAVGPNVFGPADPETGEVKLLPADSDVPGGVVLPF